MIGIDEVGRGALCGPVVSCALVLKQEIRDHNFFALIKDSKLIQEDKRNQIANLIKKFSSFSIGICNNRLIDKINILNATNLSMIRALKPFKDYPNLVKIDGLKTFELNAKTEFIKKGDKKSVVIAAASIIAKSYRDKIMIEFSKMFPEYDINNNKGYGTKKHIDAIKTFGCSPIHRKSFKPISDILF